MIGAVEPALVTAVMAVHARCAEREVSAGAPARAILALVLQNDEVVRLLLGTACARASSSSSAPTPTSYRAAAGATFCAATGAFCAPRSAPPPPEPRARAGGGRDGRGRGDLLRGAVHDRSLRSIRLQLSSITQ